MNIEDVEGIGPVHATALRAVGITTTDALLERGATAAGRAELAEASGVSRKLVLEWVNHCDLMRIDGVGSEYSDLLEAAGVDSPAELAQRNPANLARTFQELDAARPDWIRSIPSEATVEKWIAHAKTLPKIVTHGGAGEETASVAPAADEPAAIASAAPGPAASTPSTPVAVASTSEPPKPTSSTPASATTAASTPASATRSSPPAVDDTGLWSRIKRLFGG